MALNALRVCLSKVPAGRVACSRVAQAQLTRSPRSVTSLLATGPRSLSTTSSVSDYSSRYPLTKMPHGAKHYDCISIVGEPAGISSFGDEAFIRERLGLSKGGTADGAIVDCTELVPNADALHASLRDAYQELVFPCLEESGIVDSNGEYQVDSSENPRSAQSFWVSNGVENPLRMKGIGYGDEPPVSKSSVIVNTADLPGYKELAKEGIGACRVRSDSHFSFNPNEMTHWTFLNLATDIHKSFPNLSHDHAFDLAEVAVKMGLLAGHGVSTRIMITRQFHLQTGLERAQDSLSVSEEGLPEGSLMLMERHTDDAPSAVKAGHPTLVTMLFKDTGDSPASRYCVVRPDDSVQMHREGVALQTGQAEHFVITSPDESGGYPSKDFTFLIAACSNQRYMPPL